MKATREELCLFHYPDHTKVTEKCFFREEYFINLQKSKYVPSVLPSACHVLLGPRVHCSFSPIIFSTTTSHYHSYAAKSHISFWPILSPRTWTLLWSLTEVHLLHLFQSEIFMLPAPTLLLFQCPVSQQVPHCESHVPLLLLYFFFWC